MATTPASAETRRARRPATEVEKAVPGRPLAAIGTSGLREQGGWIDEEFARQLRGRRAVEVYEEMVANSAVLSGALLAIEQILKRTEIFVTPVGTSPEALERAQFVEQCLGDMADPWPEVVSEVATSIQFGWALLEQVYKRRDGEGSKYSDGLLGWDRWSIRSQETLYRWEFDHARDALVGFWQLDTYGGHGPILIPSEKFLLFRPKVTKGNPEGRSILRAAWPYWHFAKRAHEMLGIGIERDLAGMPVFKVPMEILASTATGEARLLRERLERTLANLRANKENGLLIPSDRDKEGHAYYEFELAAPKGGGGGTRQFDIVKVIELMSRMQLMVALADFIMLGHEHVGSLALSSDKTSLFATALAGWLEGWLETINRVAIPRLFRINGWPLEDLPLLQHGDLETADVEKLAKLLDSMVGAGMVLDTELENYLRKQAGWPQRAEPEELPPQPELPEPEGPGEPEEGPDGEPIQKVRFSHVYAEPDDEIEKIKHPKVGMRKGKWVVFDADDGHVYGRHDDEDSAKAQLAALYAEKARQEGHGKPAPKK